MVKLTVLNKDNSLQKKIDITDKKNLLDEMLDNDVEIFFGCFGGSCASCKCSIVEGSENIDLEAVRPLVFKGLKENEFLPCIAKIKDSNKEVVIKREL